MKKDSKLQYSHDLGCQSGSGVSYFRGVFNFNNSIFFLLFYVLINLWYWNPTQTSSVKSYFIQLKEEEQKGLEETAAVSCALDIDYIEHYDAG